MRNLPEAFQLYQQSKTWNTPPSVFLGLEDRSYEAYCFDQAIYLFGTSIESKVNALQRGKNETEHAFENRSIQLLHHLLGIKQEVKYADPAAAFGD